MMEQYDNFKKVESIPVSGKKAISLQNTIKKNQPSLRNVMEKTMERPRMSNYINDSNYNSRKKE